MIKSKKFGFRTAKVALVYIGGEFSASDSACSKKFVNRTPKVALVYIGAEINAPMTCFSD